MKKIVFIAAILFALLCLPQGASIALPAKEVTLLYTNDFHGHLESDESGRGGSARMATVIHAVRAEKGAKRVVLLDAGDALLAAPPISQLLEGESTVDIYNLLGYDVAAFGNHEFDKDEPWIISRTQQSRFPWISANIVLTDSDWEHPAWVRPYGTITVGAPGDQSTLGLIGLTTDETPEISMAPDNLAFRDPTEAVLRYYDEVMAQSDAVIILAHIGVEDVGRYKGLRTVARELAEAGKPVDLMISGHDHVPLFAPVVISDTAILSAGCCGRWLGRADIAIQPASKHLTVVHYELITIRNTITPTASISQRVAYWAEQVAPLLQRPVGSTYLSLIRDRNRDSPMGNLVTDAMRWKADLLDDGQLNGTVEVAFTNPGGLRADIQATGDLPRLITWGDTFNVMPFGNTLTLLDLTGAQIQELLDQAATLHKGILQSSGITWSWYNDTGDSHPNEWGAYWIRVGGEPLDSKRLYRVVTNNFVADGRDGWITFAAGLNRRDYPYADMQEAVNEYIGLISPIEAEDVPGGRATRLEAIYRIRLPALEKRR